MDIAYTEEKKFTMEQVQELFRSVGWVSGEYPQRLYKALMHSSRVTTAWIHYVLVHPDYQRRGIAGIMIERIKEHYKNCLYIEVMPEERKNVPFYQKHGFQIMPEGTAMVLANFADKR